MGVYQNAPKISKGLRQAFHLHFQTKIQDTGDRSLRGDWDSKKPTKEQPKGENS